MKKIILFLILIFAGISVTYFFFYKNYLQPELICEIPDPDNTFRPDGYEFFHSKNEIDRYLELNQTTKSYKNYINKTDFNFNNFSYFIVYGREVKNIYYSYKSTFFDDKSESYARPNGKIPVFINYKNEGSRNGVFIYRIERDDRLRGFYGN
ncbi:hypothetical protein [Flavobacterium microcysteis]|uniref:Uncharacterized protein n=1 Tax=Flavobacterium microcysteis TaxID=2596891 RepID=A0A501QNA6_9FLAO|nr:hypothetical protein [Flavobacterium microcysteis]TPD73741.1 hypothetical protein FJA49_00155 [Flavobacterium microcysteis]